MKKHKWLKIFTIIISVVTIWACASIYIEKSNKKASIIKFKHDLVESTKRYNFIDSIITEPQAWDNQGSDEQIIKEHVLEGELSRIQELLFAYVLNLDDTVTVINTATNMILTTITFPAGSSPSGIAITSDGSRAYVANFFNANVTVINTATNTILTTIPLPAGSGPREIAITPDSSRAYVTNDNNTVVVINTATNTILTTIPLPAGSFPRGIAITPDGSRAYVANSGNNTVTVINTATNTILTTITFPAGSAPIAIAITPDGSRAYVANFVNSTITVINTTTNTILTTITFPAGSGPRGIAITPDGSRAYVVNASAFVTVLDTAVNAVIATLSTGFNAQGIAITPILLF